MVERREASIVRRSRLVTWRLWLGVGFVSYVVLVLVAWAFIAGATRRPTPRPLDDLDEEYVRLVSDEESS